MKWGKKDYEVTIDGTTSPATLMQQVEQLTGVPITNQKLMAKKGWKGVLSNDTKLKVKPGKTTLTLMGSAADTISAVQAGPSTVTFVEDMSKTDALKATNATPPGLNNLGNTCYLNSTLQCLRAIPELRAALTCLSSSSTAAPTSEVRLSQDLHRLFYQMDSTFSPQVVTPQEFVMSLKHQHPMYAQTAPNGAPLQQDAEEFYSTCMRSLSSSLTRQQLGPAAAALDDVFGDRDGLPSSNRYNFFFVFLFFENYFLSLFCPILMEIY